MKQSMCTRR